MQGGTGFVYAWMSEVVSKEEVYTVYSTHSCVTGPDDIHWIT